MSRRVELVTASVALVIHVGLGLTITRAGKSPPPPRSKPVLLQFEPRPETPPAPPVPAAPPAAAAPHARPTPVRKLALKTPTPRPIAPPPSEPRAAAPSEHPAAASPPAPMYAVAMTSTNAMAVVASPRGAPGGTGRGTGTPGVSGSPGDGAGDGYRPAPARSVGTMPEVDAEACGRAAVYPREAEQSGTEGDVRLRVSLTESGQVHAVRVLSGLSRALDTAAIDAIKNRCKFKPAVGRDGQPVAFVIESYTFHFELPH